MEQSSLSFSAFTLVSRLNDLTIKAIDSVLKQEPDDYTLYVDPLNIKKYEFFRLVEKYDDRCIIRKQNITDCDDHHDDVTRAVHTAILNARHQWILCCDDDDEVIGDLRRFVLPYVDDDVGALYGHKIRVRPGAKGMPEFVKAGDLVNFYNPADFTGSVILYNRDAFRRVYRNIDVWNPREEYDADYGYYWDYKIAYWLVRCGYRLVACPNVLGLQNLNTNRSGKRLKLSRMWGKILRDRHQRRRYPLEAETWND